jgi:hypothetical protein
MDAVLDLLLSESACKAVYDSLLWRAAVGLEVEAFGGGKRGADDTRPLR